jgi:hypothetical protein
MRTTETVKQLGLYDSACCNEETLFDRQDTFSRCPACHSLCFWQLVEPVVSWQELDGLADEEYVRAA